MGQLNRRFPVREVCINTRTFQQHEGALTMTERSEEGDIIAVRIPHTHIGRLEGNRRLWLLMDGLEENDFDRLTSPWFEPLNDNFNIVDETVYQKRRFCIPLDRLATIAPALNTVRARNNLELYQPFQLVDTDFPFWWLCPSCAPISVYGLVYDKARSRFL